MFGYADIYRWGEYCSFFLFFSVLLVPCPSGWRHDDVHSGQPA